MAIRRDIKYIDRDFTSLRNSLINYTKTYFPNTYNDFTPASPGMMFMEMAAYVGDVLSFYVDNQFQETFIQYSRQTQNLYDLAYIFFKRPYSSYLLKTPVLAAAPDSTNHYLRISIFYIIFPFNYTPVKSYDRKLPSSFTLPINSLSLSISLHYYFSIGRFCVI